MITRDKIPLIADPREAFVNRWGTYNDEVRVRREDRTGFFPWLFAREWAAIDGKHRTNLLMKSLAYLWECDWCMGFWVAGAITWLTTAYLSVPAPWLVWGAAAAGVGLLAELEGWVDKASKR